jgi:hypothetical protein
MIDIQAIIDDINDYLDNLFVDVENIFDEETDEDIELITFENSLYDLYYYLLMLLKENKLKGVSLSPFRYPDSFCLYVDNTKFTIVVISCKDKENYSVYTAIACNDVLMKLKGLNYKNLYKEQKNDSSIVQEINETLFLLSQKSQS